MQDMVRKQRIKPKKKASIDYNADQNLLSESFFKSKVTVFSHTGVESKFEKT